MSKHPKFIPGYEDPKKLAKVLENASYNDQQKFFKEYAEKIYQQSRIDLKNGKKELGAWLSTLFSLASTCKTVLEKICEIYQKKAQKEE